LLLAEDPKTLPQAVEQLAEAVRLSPREPRMHYNYGLALQRLGRPEEAEKQFLAACELQPGVIEYLHAMRILHMQQQQWSKAAAAVEKLLRLQPRNSQLRELLYRLKRQAKEETPEPDSKPQS